MGSFAKRTNEVSTELFGEIRCAMPIVTNVATPITCLSAVTSCAALGGNNR
jgi:hypothetical protein